MVYFQLQKVTQDTWKKSEFAQQESNLTFHTRSDAQPFSYQSLVGARPYN